ncbi:MAG: gluconate 2-dehydrogenase subunit 3 family protein [Vicinamibacterales bacterium]
MDRRQALRVLGGTPAAALAFTWTAEEASAAAAQATQARAQAAARRQPYRPRFFTASEYATVVALADTIIPRDARSGSASDAGAPEFIDYIVAEQPARQTAMRGGLVWLDSECRRRFDKTFVSCAVGERGQVLDDIAWPARARRELSHGVQFFTTMRDLVATGFWSSRIGVDDIGYLGNRPVGEWPGAPAAVLLKLGVSYE